MKKGNNQKSILGFTMFFIALNAIAYSPMVHAQVGEGGDKIGGGGDSKTEGRIDDIRSDILQWINEGGSLALKFQQGITNEKYVSKMSEVLILHRVVVSAIATAQEKLDDEELNTSVLGQPKTCKGFISKKDSLLHILCNIERFAGTSESDQYRLIHHEFAGLAGVEKNVGASSDYSISNQITDFLIPTTVLRLAVKPKPVPNEKIKRVCRVLGNDWRFGDYNYCADVESLENGEIKLTNITVQRADLDKKTFLKATNQIARVICRKLVSANKEKFTRSSKIKGYSWKGTYTAHYSWGTKKVNNGYYTQKIHVPHMYKTGIEPAFETLNCQR